ncbi:hypothetical protein CCH79_00011616 [Gambusia affinis]|uniref:Protein kinase domain-containing protein n=1 Tax=Gambusia affinis TaxID=33528 RepID=A0A315VUZ7_GAMAF|nr:hypothetical protein CCH79_00011616 [Gambusia affinis]
MTRNGQHRFGVPGNRSGAAAAVTLPAVCWAESQGAGVKLAFLVWLSRSGSWCSATTGKEGNKFFKGFGSFDKLQCESKQKQQKIIKELMALYLAVALLSIRIPCWYSGVKLNIRRGFEMKGLLSTAGSAKEQKSSTGRYSMSRCPNSVSTATSDEQPHIGNYRLLKTIGKGNFAKVKLARHVLTSKEKECSGRALSICDSLVPDTLITLHVTCWHTKKTRESDRHNQKED